MLIVMFLLSFFSKPTYHLVVVNGIGSGVYQVGKHVKISTTVLSGQTLSQWSAYPDDTTLLNFHRPQTYVVMPPHDVKVTAMFSPLPPARAH